MFRHHYFYYKVTTVTNANYKDITTSDCKVVTFPTIATKLSMCIQKFFGEYLNVIG